VLGRRDPQRKLFSAAQQLGETAIKKLGFYGKLASEGYKMFRDEDFVGAYCEDNGRPSVPPSMLTIALLLQHHDGVSDAETIARHCFDLRWKVAQDLELASIQQPFAKSTFQAFRARLTLHRQEGLAFERSIRAAKDAGLLPKRLRLSLDSSPVRGRGAIKDTFNLLSDAIVAVLRAIGVKREVAVEDVAREADLQRHTDAPSIKGTETVDWGDTSAVDAFLEGIVNDCERTVRLAAEHECATDEVMLLKKIVEQDIERNEDGSPKIKQGVAKDRTVSVHDPEMRHGRKSSGKGYNGHKAHIAVDTETGVITAIGMTSPGEADGSQVEALIEQTKRNTQAEVEQALGDTAYSSSTAVSQAKKAEVDLVAKMPSTPAGRLGPDAFKVSPDGRSAACPAGHASVHVHRNKDGIEHCWSEKLCAVCPLRKTCTTGKFRTLRVPANFHDRRERERYVRSEEGRLLLRQRVKVEHAIGRLKNLGAGAARCFGRAKTKIEWMWYAAVANLSLVWGNTEAPAVG
jgi:hypothetical protein